VQPGDRTVDFRAENRLKRSLRSGEMFSISLDRDLALVRGFSHHQRAPLTRPPWGAVPSLRRIVSVSSPAFSGRRPVYRRV